MDSENRPSCPIVTLDFCLLAVGVKSTEEEKLSFRAAKVSNSSLLPFNDSLPPDKQKSSK